MTLLRIFHLLIILISINAFSQSSLQPIVFYLQNLPHERIGTLTDEVIIDSLENQNFLVIPIDCSSYPRTNPELEEALIDFHEKTSPTLLTEHFTYNQISSLEIFYVPEGYLLKTQIPIWNIKEHGAEGSIERIMDTYNNEIVSMYDVQPVTDPDDMVDKYGNPIDYNMYMHLIYPSGSATNQVPLLMVFSSSSQKQDIFNPIKPDRATIHRNIYPLGFLTSGYAFANVDHPYNPLARDHVYRYFDRYSLENWNGLALSRAYVRYLRHHANEYNLNGKIGAMGISKASYSVVRIADSHNATAAEHSLFNNTPNNKPQPWEGHESTIDVAWAAAGTGTIRVPLYVNSNTVPISTSAGLSDPYGHWDLYPQVVKHFKDHDLNHLPFWMEDLGHNFPVGTDLATGEKRYRLLKRYFDHYLTSTVNNPLSVFYAFPKENSTDVTTRGYSRILVKDELLPSRMSGLTAYEPITVRFLSEIALSEIEENIKIYETSTNTEIEGEWKSTMQNTAYVFEPTNDLVVDGTYKIVVKAGLTNLTGQTLVDDFEREFIVHTVEEVPEIQLPSIESAVFMDDFERDDYTKGGYPETNYRVTYDVLSGGSPFPPSISNGVVLRLPSRNATNAVGRVYIMGELSSYLDPFKPKLSEITSDSVVWTFNKRFTWGGLMGGFGRYENGSAVILTASEADLSKASGYALVYGDSIYGKRFRIVNFTNGIDGNEKLTNIAAGTAEIHQMTPGTAYHSLKIVYVPTSNTWKLYFRLDGNTRKDPIEDESPYSFIASGIDNAHVDVEMKYFGFLNNYYAPTGGDRIYFYDNYAVRLFDVETNTNTNNIVDQVFYRLTPHRQGFSLQAENAFVTLFDINGTIVQEKKINGYNTFNSLQSGFYVLKIQTDKGESSIQKLIIP